MNIKKMIKKIQQRTIPQRPVQEVYVAKNLQTVQQQASKYKQIKVPARIRKLKI